MSRLRNLQGSLNHAVKSNPNTLFELLQLFEAPSSAKTTEALEAAEMALVTENVDRSMTIDDLPDTTDEMLEQVRDGIHEHLAVGFKVATGVHPVQSSTSRFRTLQLVAVNQELDIEVVSAERLRHEPAFVSRAVRQRRGNLLCMSADTLKRFDTQGPTLRESLILHLDTLGVRITASNTTAGVNRQIRHTGTFATHTSSTHVKNSAVVRQSAASAFLHRREQALSSLRGIHENFLIANITTFNPLAVGSFVIVLRPVTKAESTKREVLLGRVLTMYSKSEAKGSRHDWVDSATSVGLISNVFVEVFTRLGGNNFTSLACATLGTSTFMAIPRTHVVFSLASTSSASDISLQSFGSHGPFTVASLDQFSMEMFSNLSKQEALLYAGAELLKTRKPLAPSDEVGDESDYGSDVVEGTA